MDILINLIFLHLKKIFDFKTHPIKTIGTIIFLFIFISYGYMFSYLYNSTDFGIKVLSYEKFEYFLILWISIITFFRGFFPSYKPVRYFVTHYFPISKFKNFLYNIINEFITPFYLGLFLFILSFSISVNKKALVLFLCVLIWSATAHFAKRFAQLLIEFEFKGKKIISIVSIFLVSGIILFFTFYSKDRILLNYIFSLIIMGTLFLLNYFIELHKTNFRITTRIKLNKSVYNLSSLKLLLNNKLLRTMLLLSIVVKLVLIFAGWSVYVKKGHYFSDSEFFIYLFISPLVFFSYFFNNFFGFVPTFWLTLEIVGTNFFIYTKETLKIILFPLILDTILTTVFFIISDKFNYINVSFYLSNLILLFYLGLLNSFFLPKKVDRLFSFGGTTSPLANFYSLLAVTMLIFITKYFPNFTLIVSLTVTLSLYFLTKRKFHSARYKLFQKLLT